jgi:hypothetical protein
MMGIHRTNKGSAWAWLKSELVDKLGQAEANMLLTGYYDRLALEAKDRRRVAAAAEIPQLQLKLDAAILAGSVREVRKLERMIEVRRRLVG